MLDVIIIGMGPGGMSAAIYAKRSGLNTLIIEKSQPGGLVNITNKVDNYLGHSNVKGVDLAFDMFNHVNSLEIPYVIEEVEEIKITDKEKIVITNKNEYKTKEIIICGGRQAKKVGVKALEKYEGKGVSYCATCDAPLYKNKKVAVVGGGNSAFEEGIYLSDFASEVNILVRSNNIRADQILVDEAKTRKNINILLNSEIENVIEEEDKLKGVILNNKNELLVDGVFVFVGYEPSVLYLQNLNILTKDGYIEVDNEMRTKIPGIYAAGDIIKKSLYQIVTATSDGAIAAVSAKKDISKM